MWKDMIVAYFRELSQHFTGETEASYKTVIKESWTVRWESKPGNPEYEIGVLNTQQKR